ncbi:hypothetical protein MNEG_8477 [Monoraphidium neglectum]|uniref:COX assembly mitochondrial protein n=1 Tax=Monoraphidium neglectum TaxID=145388 RepID=A0A0D2MFK2_9CHLO|nr:hypothetical protein MNEG_8477 [Monoraphidium neglectum]KIY99486.1 hypothetical protein MNEG_8477 [Monoraphidium neglectum]|eukprot:XP_013898506.1 hypothetical protein MNEG_8477 [Monoraphidium neglectum]
MHPPLIIDKHPICAEFIEALTRCHKEHSVAKWWGACNDPKFELTKCLDREKKELRAARQEKAKAEFREKQERSRQEREKRAQQEQQQQPQQPPTPPQQQPRQQEQPQSQQQQQQQQQQQRQQQQQQQQQAAQRQPPLQDARMQLLERAEAATACFALFFNT